jgi:hypothetical protein
VARADGTRAVGAVLLALLALAAEAASPSTSALATTCGVDVTCYTLTINLGVGVSTGTGSFKATDANWNPVPGGLDCEMVSGHIVEGSKCSATYKDIFHQGYVQVYWAATPASDSIVCKGANCQLAPVQGGIMLASDTTLSIFRFYDAEHTFTIDLAGTGSGSWKSTNASHVPDGLIDCELLNGAITPSSVCEHTYPDLTHSGVTVYYVETAATGSRLCSSDCVTSLTGSIGVAFDLTFSDEWVFSLNTYTLNVSKSGAGAGTVTSTPAGISCGSTCSASLGYGTQLQLTAKAAAGSVFGGWTGACAFQPATCTFTLTGDSASTAVFNLATSSPSPAPASTPQASGLAATPGGTASPSASTATAEPGQGSPATSPPPPVEATTAPGETTGSLAGSGTGGPASSPAVAPVGQAADLTPIVLAIVFAALIVGMAIVFGAWLLLRRRGVSA